MKNRTRKICFRAWDKNKKIMYQGGAWHWNMEYEHIAFPLEVGDESYTIADENLVLMQFTGLKDKNGKEIYEGDILSYHWKDEELHIGNVFWYKEGFWKIKWKDFKGTESKLDDLLALFYYGSKVIGNIYENSELLQKP